MFGMCYQLILPKYRVCSWGWRDVSVMPKLKIMLTWLWGSKTDYDGLKALTNPNLHSSVGSFVETNTGAGGYLRKGKNTSVIYTTCSGSVVRENRLHLQRVLTGSKDILLAWWRIFWGILSNNVFQHFFAHVFFQDNIVGCKAFISTPVEISGAALANIFHEVRNTSHEQRYCCDSIKRFHSASPSISSHDTQTTLHTPFVVRCNRTRSYVPSEWQGLLFFACVWNVWRFSGRGSRW